MRFKIGDKVRYYYGKDHTYNKEGRWYVQNEGEIIACGKYDNRTAYIVAWKNVPKEFLHFFDDFDGGFLCLGNVAIVLMMGSALLTEEEIVMEAL